jgi:predicted YcjX-like family ATPase
MPILGANGQGCGVLGQITDGINRRVENAVSGVSEALFEPVIRLGVTGLSRAGKTVFITSLVANLLDRGRMPQFSAAPRIDMAFLQPQPDDTLPRFDYESHLAALTGANPHWPASTRAISELRLSLRVQPSGFLGSLLGGLTGPRTVHLDIIDYPGEWLLDLGLMAKTYAEWSEATLTRIAQRTQAAGFMALARAEDGSLRLEEPRAQVLAEAFTAYLQAARAAGWSDCTPGRFLLPGDLAGSPVLTFAPLPKPGQTPRGSLYREMDRRFEAYKSRVIKPFFRDHFARLDRQVVLMDVLGALHSGPMALEDMRRTMAEILGAFRPGQNGFLRSILRGKRVDRILFAATKADHLHHSQHPRLTAITEALLREARDRAAFAGAETRAMSLAALRATVEETRQHNGEMLDLVRGTLQDSGKPAAMFAGLLPEDPNHLIGPARKGEAAWLNADYAVMNFAPARLTLRPGDGPPHIRLDRAAEFLLADRLG